jgi:ADP-L-glycero-D-manno-heptose 6-epimerase
MIVVTGAAGFIASCVVAELNNQNYVDLVLVDDFSHSSKEANYKGKKYSLLVDRKAFANWLDENHTLVQFVIHLGARTDTTEFDTSIFEELNIGYSKMVWNKCVEYGLPLIYASSAATYGLGELGYSDSHDVVNSLKPLNPYGDSKNDFDKWVLQQKRAPFFWAGLKFFNVYGPNENHKGRMASVIFHAFHQIRQNGKMKLFRSHREGYADGEQSRDFVYVKDVVSMIMFLMKERPSSGIYNVGSGKARSFKDLVLATFSAMEVEPNIEFIDTPEDIRDTYQYFTEADMGKIQLAGYSDDFYSLEEGVKDYVQQYLIPEKYR